MKWTEQISEERGWESEHFAIKRYGEGDQAFSLLRYPGEEWWDGPDIIGHYRTVEAAKAAAEAANRPRKR